MHTALLLNTLIKGTCSGVKEQWYGLGKNIQTYICIYVIGTRKSRSWGMDDHVANGT